MVRGVGREEAMTARSGQWLARKPGMAKEIAMLGTNPLRRPVAGLAHRALGV
jgi:hypothetical protein